MKEVDHAFEVFGFFRVKQAIGGDSSSKAVGFSPLQEFGEIGMQQWFATGEIYEADTDTTEFCDMTFDVFWFRHFHRLLFPDVAEGASCVAAIGDEVVTEDGHG